MNKHSQAKAAARAAGFRAAFMAALLLAAAAQGALAQNTDGPRREDFEAPMRDGVKLATAVFFPEGSGPWPTILSRTPYNLEGLKGFAKDCAKRGYVFVAQDCRGRFKSPGVYVPFKNDREDGYDTVEWCAAQPWSDGKIGMWGGSALGITSNLAAAAGAPHLVCAYVIVAPASFRHETLWIGGLWRKEMMDGWMEAQKSTEVRKQWTATPIMDPYFDSFEIYPDYKRIRVPIYNVAGWYDIFLKGGIQNFQGVQSKGAGPARGNQKLLIGALAHGQISSTLKYPAGSGDMRGEDTWRWFAYWLKGEQNGIMQEPAIRYYLMGDMADAGAPGNYWTTADAWPPEGEAVSYYLNADGTLSTAKPKAKGSYSRFAHDPANPVPTEGGSNLVIVKKGPMDQRAIGERPDYFRFHSEPLAEPLAVIGEIAAELFVSSEAPDTDFIVKLVDVYPDGYEALIQEGALRLRFRKGFGKERMMKPGKIEKVKIDMWSTANVFNKGHRIGVHVASSNDPRYDPNPGTGKPLRADDEKRIAHNTFWHSRNRASRVILPVAPIPAAEAKNN